MPVFCEYNSRIISCGHKFQRSTSPVSVDYTGQPQMLNVLIAEMPEREPQTAHSCLVVDKNHGISSSFQPTTHQDGEDDSDDDDDDVHGWMDGFVTDSVCVAAVVRKFWWPPFIWTNPSDAVDVQRGA